VESDKALGMGLFESIYGQSPIVFGSFPSLHATWPIVCCIPFIAIKGWKFAPYAIVYWLWIWFAAIYLKHHFLTDILGAIFIAALAFVLKCIVFRTMNIPNKIYFQCSDCTFDTFTYKMKKTRNYKDITLDSNIYWTENTEYSVAL
jgi:membrane-associated phospholipid phosphatase